MAGPNFHRVIHHLTISILELCPDTDLNVHVATASYITSILGVISHSSTMHEVKV